MLYSTVLVWAYRTVLCTAVLYSRTVHPDLRSILNPRSSIYARYLRSILNLMLTKDENDGRAKPGISGLSTTTLPVLYYEITLVVASRISYSISSRVVVESPIIPGLALLVEAS